MITFKRYAGSLQMELRTFADVREALEVPKTLWVATACPVDGLNCDKGFLRYLDADGNGRVRVEELTKAVEWTAEMLADATGCDESSDVLELGRLADAAGRIRDAAKLVLEAQDAPSRDSISLAQVRASEAPLRAAYFNGDGLVARESVDDVRLSGVVDLMLACVPATTNRSGRPGVSKEHLADVRARVAKAQEHLARRGAVFVWGDASEARADAVRTVRPRVDEYFLQCRLVAAQPDAALALRLGPDAIAASVGDATALARAASVAPVAPPAPDGTLEWARLHRGPHFEALEKLRADVFEPAFGAEARMSEAQWRDLSAHADAIGAWHDVVAADKVFERFAELERVSDDDYAAVARLCDEDLARREQLDAVAELEKLILYQRWLLRFANNFISMPDLYDPAFTALFERGRLLLAGRLFTLSVLVKDHAAHAALAAKGTMCIAYLRVLAREGGESFEVAVPVTYGTAAGVEVGKRGVFIDTDGREWDAVVLQVISNPVSLWEAMAAPYRKISAFVSSKVESWAGDGDKALEAQMNRGYEQAQRVHDSASTAARQAADGTPAPAGASAATPAGAQPAAGANGGAGGNVAIAVSIAISAVSAAIGTVVGLFAGKSLFEIAGMVLMLFLIVSLPAGVFAWLKLRKRDMGIVLEACGWALNERMLLGEYLGPLFTRRPARPRGARVEVLDSVQATIEKRRAAGLDEIERTGLRPVHWVLLVALVLGACAYKARGPLCGLASARGWLRPQTCAALR